MEWRELQAVWNGEISTIRPIGDFVLVRPFPREHGTGSLIIDPGTQMTKDGRWRTKNRLRGNQMGEVIAVGKGDRMFGYICCFCSFIRNAPTRDFRIAGARTPKCSICHEPMYLAMADRVAGIPLSKRAPMNVQPGDIVIYPQVPANEVSINGERLIFLHEEQHVLAVVEEEVAACSI